jgi:hypothetical protein
MNGHRLFPALKVGASTEFGLQVGSAIKYLRSKIEDRGLRIEDRRGDPLSSIFNLQIGKAN